MIRLLAALTRWLDRRDAKARARQQARAAEERRLARDRDRWL